MGLTSLFWAVVWPFVYIAKAVLWLLKFKPLPVPRGPTPVNLDPVKWKADHENRIHRQAFKSKDFSDTTAGGPAHYDVIVIGAGVSGLTVASVMAQHGKRVLVLEQNESAGGGTHNFVDHGFEWDAGLHYVGEMTIPNGELRAISDYITEGRLEWNRLGDDKVVISRPSQSGLKREWVDIRLTGQDDLRSGLVASFPEEQTSKAVDNLVKEGKRVRFFTMLNELLKPLPAWLRKIIEVPYHRFFYFPTISDQTAKQALERIFPHNEVLRGVLSQVGFDIGLQPRKMSWSIHASLYAHYLEGGNFPVGGSVQFAKEIIPIVERHGGKVLVKANVNEIIVETKSDGKHRARGVRVSGRKETQSSKGIEIHADVVVSTTSMFKTFGSFLPTEVSRKYGYAEKLASIKPSIGHYYLFIGLKGSQEELKLGSGHTFIYPDNEKSHDVDGNYDRFFSDPNEPFPIVFVCFPSAKDPTYNIRFPNKSTCILIVDCKYEWFEEWSSAPAKHRGTEYEQVKAGFSERLLKVFYDHWPELKDRVEVHEAGTPLSNSHFLGAVRGESYGYEFTPEFYRRTESWAVPETPIENLFISGQAMFTDGIGPNMFTGTLTSSAILRENVFIDCYNEVQRRNLRRGKQHKHQD